MLDLKSLIEEERDDLANVDVQARRHSARARRDRRRDARAAL